MAKQSGSMNPLALKMALGLSLTMLFSACDRNENGEALKTPTSEGAAGSAGGEGFARELLALKAQNGGRGVSDEAITALLSKYGLPNPMLDAHRAEQADPGLEEAKALPKSAASSVYVPMRKANLNLNMTLYSGATVPAGVRMEAWTARTADNQSVDPVLIAYYKIGNDAIGSTIRVVAMNDDFEGGLDPRISWVNNTGATSQIEIIAYGFSAGTSGMGTLKVKTGGITRSYAGRFGGVHLNRRNVTSSKPLEGCVYDSDELIMTRNIRDSEAGFSIAVSWANNVGAFLSGDFDIGGAATTSVRLPVGLKAVEPDFLLSFVPWSGRSIFNATSYTAIQYQKFSCP